MISTVHQSHECVSCVRYEELEEALSIAEQHISNRDQQQAVQQKQDRVDELRHQLSEGLGVIEDLETQLQAARTAATQQHQTTQVDGNMQLWQQVSAVLNHPIVENLHADTEHEDVHSCCSSSRHLRIVHTACCDMAR